MIKCFFITASESKTMNVSAIAHESIDITQEMTSLINSRGELSFDLMLKCVLLENGNLIYTDDLSKCDTLWFDYQITNLSCPLFSERMKIFFDDKFTGNENIHWIKTNVYHSHEKRNYYIPRFKKALDVLDTDKTTYISGTGHIIVPCFSSRKVINYALFHLPYDVRFLWEIPSGVYVHEGIKKMIVHEKFTGVNFEKIKVS
ncbi:MAG: hypothetical protein Ta2F_17890 [Termitinemataceae bacterium]|nr:MAG: hypothetical protein Ta2F_17890 [Termitinemataceae bacterium]